MFKIFKKFSQGVASTGKRVWNSIGSVFKIEKLDEHAISEIEKSLYTADFGVKTTREIITEIKTEYKKNKNMRGKDAYLVARKVLENFLENAEQNPIQKQDKPQVICLVGVNGSGKTTTAAKLAEFYSTAGYSILLAGCDTFRAAASEQIQIWASRLHIDIVNGQHGGDSAAIAYDAYKSTLSKHYDIVILDTAGRLHVKTNLMQELQKISRTLQKLDSEVKLYNWIVVDGNIGSNSLESAKSFHDSIKLDGVIITKLDGSSRGGSIVGIHRELGLPILFIGTGEQASDLLQFSSKNYVDTIFGDI